MDVNEELKLLLKCKKKAKQIIAGGGGVNREWVEW